MNNNMKIFSKPIVIALVFASLLIASSYFLKGKPVGNWVNAVIYTIWIYIYFRYTIFKKCTTPKADT